MDKHKIYILLSFISIYVIWGSTYLFVAIVVKEVPPFLLAGIRFLTASIIIFVVIKIIGLGKLPTKLQVKNSMIAGFLFLALGNGGVSWALQYIDSGLTALIISAQPLILLLMLWLLDRKPLAAQSWVGVLLGMVGMFILFHQETITSSEKQLYGILVIFGCLLAWGSASIFVNRSDMPTNYFYNAAIQMFIGGIILLISGFIFENWHDVPWFELKIQTYLAELFLIFFGSIVAFTAFNFLLSHVSPEKVSTSTYINPIIALILGYFILNEQISVQSIIAAFILLTGVYFINTKRQLKFKFPFRPRI